MLRKITSLIISLICILGLFSCSEPERQKLKPLPPVSTVGLPEDEKLVTSYETEGFAVNIYETYSEIVEYKGNESTLIVPDTFMGLPLKAIAEYAFFENATLSAVTLPDSLIFIGNGAFQECSVLKEVILGNSLEVISQSAFRDSALETINLPESLAEIGRYAFFCTRLKEIKIPQNVSDIAKYTFFGCEQLTKVELCQRINRIAEYAFSGCISLRSFVISERTKTVGDYAFAECTSLEKIFIPIQTMVGENPFLNCENLTIYAPADSKIAGVAQKYGYSFKSCASADKMP